MSASIYAFVKRKLITHGVNKTPDGMVTIQNKLVFLDFVRLERAVRRADFIGVQAAVRQIDERVTSLGKRHLVVFAYMYLYLSDGTPRLTRADIQLGSGRILCRISTRPNLTPKRISCPDACYGHRPYSGRERS